MYFPEDFLTKSLTSYLFLFQVSLKKKKTGYSPVVNMIFPADIISKLLMGKMVKLDVFHKASMKKLKVQFLPQNNFFPFAFPVN